MKWAGHKEGPIINEKYGRHMKSSEEEAEGRKPSISAGNPFLTVLSHNRFVAF